MSQIGTIKVGADMSAFSRKFRLIGEGLLEIANRLDAVEDEENIIDDLNSEIEEKLDTHGEP